MKSFDMWLHRYAPPFQIKQIVKKMDCCETVTARAIIASLGLTWKHGSADKRSHGY